jgi:S1-C subfamily serine protease
MRHSEKLLAMTAVILGILLYSDFATLAGSRQPPGKDIWTAICPVVYQLDETPAERGYHYIFYGNAFFINDEGYLLTAAHVLNDFDNGGQPQILLRLAEAPPRLVKIKLIASDPQHDVAVLRAIPNPFEGKYAVSTLPLSSEKVSPGSSILVAALRPVRIEDPHSWEAPQQDSVPAGVLEYTAIPLNKGAPKSELFLFDHEVIRGQSGAPILSQDSLQVIGFVEGQWLHGVPLATAKGNATTLGAGISITYALPLLEENRVAWRNAFDSGNRLPEGKEK